MTRAILLYFAQMVGKFSNKGVGIFLLCGFDELAAAVILAPFYNLQFMIFGHFFIFVLTDNSMINSTVSQEMKGGRWILTASIHQTDYG